MFKHVLLTALLWAVGVSSQSSFAATPHPAKKVTAVVPGVVYVQYKEGSRVLQSVAKSGGSRIQSISSDRYDRIIRQLGVTEMQPFDAASSKDAVSKSLGIDRIYVIYYSNPAIDPHRAVSQLLQTSEVEKASCRYMFPLSLKPNDPRINEQYALTKMSVYNAWDATCGDSNVVVADVDCAFNIDHEDLRGEIKYNSGEVGTDADGKDKRTNGKDDDGDGYVDNWQGWDLVGTGGTGLPFRPDNNPRPDTNLATHGSLTAGCIVATGNNSKGIAGVAFGCRLLPIKASNSRYSDFILAGYEGIHYASTHGAKVISCSWGGPISTEDVNLANIFLNEATTRNSLVVAASGNESKNIDISPDYPANGPGVLTVGSTGSTDAASGFGNYGHSVAVYAPGENILSTNSPGTSSYLSESGTSFATPLTAGVAALVYSQHPTWMPKFVARQIIQTCDNVINTADQYDFWGRVNAEKALTTQQWPGLIPTQYSLNGVANDSLEVPGVQQNLKVILKNVVATGSNIMARLVEAPGYTTNSSAFSIGSMAVNSTAEASFHIVRTDEYTDGLLPVKIFVYDQSALADTITVMIPMKRIAGFKMIEMLSHGSSIKRTDNKTAWAGFGYDPGTGSVISQYATELFGDWDTTQILDDGSVAPYCVEARDYDHAWFGTGSASVAYVISTDDGGGGFTSKAVSTITPFVNTIHFFDALNGVFIGDPLSSKWGIGITTDGGLTWKRAAKAPSAPGSEASWNNATSWVGRFGWFGTNRNHIWHSTDSGQTWKSVTVPQPNALSVAVASDSIHGFACCRPAPSSSGSATFTGVNALLYTMDGGASWKEISRPDTMVPGSVAFIPDTTIAIFTSSAGMYRTNDFGASWSRIPMPLSFDASGAAIDISRDNDSVVISALGESVGLVSYSMYMPKPLSVSGTSGSSAGLRLDAPVPNPANAVTTVTYSHERSEHVTVRVADALGREVATLIDANRPAGSESLTFDTGSLPAGVYYVLLQTGSGASVSRSISVGH